MIKDQFRKRVGVCLFLGFLFLGVRLWFSFADQDGICFLVVMKSSITDTAKVYYDLGQGFSETNSSELQIKGDQYFHEYLFKIPHDTKSLRFDPVTAPGNIIIRHMEELVSVSGKRLGSVDLQQLRSANHIKGIDIHRDEAVVMIKRMIRRYGFPGVPSDSAVI